MNKQEMIDILHGNKYYGKGQKAFNDVQRDCCEIADYIEHAEPVVRCKDCILSMPAYTNGKISETEIYCPSLDIRKPIDWHCGDGLAMITCAE